MVKTKYKLGQEVLCNHNSFNEMRLCTVRGMRLGTLHDDETAEELGIRGLENEELLYELVDCINKQIFFQVPENKIHDLEVRAEERKKFYI